MGRPVDLEQANAASIPRGCVQLRLSLGDGNCTTIQVVRPNLPDDGLGLLGRIPLYWGLQLKRTTTSVLGLGRFGKTDDIANQ